MSSIATAVFLGFLLACFSPKANAGCGDFHTYIPPNGENSEAAEPGGSLLLRTRAGLLGIDAYKSSVPRLPCNGPQCQSKPSAPDGTTPWGAEKITDQFALLALDVVSQRDRASARWAIPDFSETSPHLRRLERPPK